MKSTTKLGWAIGIAVTLSIIAGIISYNSIYQRYQKERTVKIDSTVKKK